jgi:hypothetical protein
MTPEKVSVREAQRVERGVIVCGRLAERRQERVREATHVSLINRGRRGSPQYRLLRFLHTDYFPTITIEKCSGDAQRMSADITRHGF